VSARPDRRVLLCVSGTIPADLAADVAVDAPTTLKAVQR